MYCNICHAECAIHDHINDQVKYHFGCNGMTYHIIKEKGERGGGLYLKIVIYFW